jgi:nucleotide-binding universal stress UspA family protein
MFQRGLICTDLSDGLSRLKDFIPHLAQSGLKQVVFVHSVPLWEEGSVPRIDQEKIEDVKNFFADLLSKNYAGIEVKVEIVSGRPTDHIPKLVEQYQSDVIFMGTPIRSLLQEKIFGSTSMAVAKATNTPFLILRPQLVSTYTCAELALRCEHLWDYLLIPYNDHERDHYLIEQIKKIVAQNEQSTLTKCLLCWVIDEGGGSKEMSIYHQQQAQEKLAQVKEDLENSGLEVVTCVRQGNHLHEILDVALEYDISAIAISLIYQRNIFKWTLPNLANDILRHSWFPVLFFSPEK